MFAIVNGHGYGAKSLADTHQKSFDWTLSSRQVSYFGLCSIYLPDDSSVKMGGYVFSVASMCLRSPIGLEIGARRSFVGLGEYGARSAGGLLV